MRIVDYALDEREDFLLGWLRRELPSAVTARVRTGFFTLGGLAGVEADLEALVERGGRLEAVIGGGPLQYELRALRELLGLSEAFPGRVDTFVVMAPDFQNSKTYLVEHVDGHWSAWVGSANLTNGGMVSNFETAVVFDSREDGGEVTSRILEAFQAVVAAPTVRHLDNRLLRQLRSAAQAARFDKGRIDVDFPEQLADILLASFDKIDKIASLGPEATIISTGLTDLDATLAGLWPGTLTVIASRPGAGRTSLALTMVRAATFRQGKPAAIFTFDMLEDDVVQRVVSAEASIKMIDMRSGRMSDAEWTRIAQKMVELSECPLYVEAGSAPDLDSLCEAVAESVAEHELRLVVIDPMTLIISRSFADNREREVAEIARRLKALAMELRVAIVVCADLGRQADNRTDKRPRISDLRDTDTIEHVADIVLLLHRPDLYERDDPRMGEADVIVAKNRGGPTSTVTVAHQLHYSRFVTLDLSGR